MTQSNITCEQVFKAAKDSLLNDQELYLNEKDIYPGVKLSRRHHGLGLDDTAQLQLIMDLEKNLNVKIDDAKIIDKKFSTLDEFCYAIYLQINKKQSSETTSSKKDVFDMSKEDIYKAIEKHIYETYTIPYVQPTSNWYADLNLTNFEFDVFREWVKKEFNVELSPFYYTNIYDICHVIYFDMQMQKAKQTFHNRIKNIVNKFKRTK